MKEWFGSAAVCINENNEVLMVKGFHSDAWAIPSGGIEKGETPEECCVREVMEETGYEVVVVDKFFIKDTTIKDIKVKTHYFRVKKIGESQGINDPDKIIEKVDWKSLSEVEKVNHAYLEDREFLLNIIKNSIETKKMLNTKHQFAE
ncbi:NUDIX hydrolase [Bacillus sp. FJAT-49711]|uniref:NUDIX hydrolase n=1 Tax=Bacillus sp. FJAT-49711 TaxID=2833585 RepID=UPI001BCA1975|nr:NUDIX hydrolase [Bacillus sp. FJAT-49711]MBS4220273.1 NUDIX hydrolase [Bacillus sp. FJAT-49711]